MVSVSALAMSHSPFIALLPLVLSQCSPRLQAVGVGCNPTHPTFPKEKHMQGIEPVNFFQLDKNAMLVNDKVIKSILQVGKLQSIEMLMECRSSLNLF